MKLNRMFLASILLLIILAIGAASASEDISDDVAAIEPTDDVVIEAVEDEVDVEALDQEIEEKNLDGSMLGDTEDDIKNEFEVNITDNLNNDDHLVVAYIKSNRKGNLSFFINDEKKEDYGFTSAYGRFVYFESYNFYSSFTDSGIYTLKVNFLDDDGQFNVTLAEKPLFYMNWGRDEPSWYASPNELLTYSLRFPDVSSGSATFYEYGPEGIGKELGSANIINKTATIEISGFVNEYSQIFVKYSTDLADGNLTTNIYVFNNTENVAVSVPKEIVQGDKAIITLKSNESAKAFIIVDGKITEYSNALLVNHILPALAVGTHTVRVVFANNPGQRVPFYSNTFKVIVKAKASPVVKPVKKATKIIAKKKTFKVKTKVKKYTITLKSGTKLVKKVKVTLKVKGKTYKATTNSKGKATFKIKNLKKKGKFNAVIKFAGNKNYKASSKKVKITVKK